MTKPAFVLLMVSLLVKISYSQYQYHNEQRTNDNSVNCEGTRDTTLVEHFFNLIFAEFYGFPPICTCVQMCADQPVYCYPNGCMKMKIKDQTLIQKEDKRVSLIIKDQNLNFSSNAYETPQNVNPNTKVTDNTVDLLPNILKERYKTLIKYKRTPSAELKHNLQQQVTTRRPPKPTIGNAYWSKARWPNRHKMQLRSKTIRINEAKLLTSMFNGNTPINTETIVNKTTLNQKNKQDETIKRVNLSIKNSTLKDTDNN